MQIYYLISSSNSGFQLTYSVDHPKIGGKFYWAVFSRSASIPMIADILSGTNAYCFGKILFLDTVLNKITKFNFLHSKMIVILPEKKIVHYFAI